MAKKKTEKYELKLVELQEFKVEPLEGKDHVAFTAMSNTSIVLQMLDIEHWVASGTLLGIHRDDSIVSTGPDVDFAINWDQAKGKTATLTREMYKKGLRLVHISMLNENHVSRMMYYDPVKHVIVDLTFYHRVGDNMITVKKHGVIRQPIEQLFPLQKVVFNKIKFFAPADVPGYLETRFGPNWEKKSDDGVHYDIDKNLRGKQK